MPAEMTQPMKPISLAGRGGPVVVLMLGLLATVPTWAEEYILLNNGIRLSGVLLAWDDREVKIRLANGLEKTYPLSDVKDVQADYSQFHLTGNEMLAQHRYKDAITNFEYALDRERSRPWAARRIEMSLLQAHQALGQLDQAGDLFLKIAARRSDVNVMALAPLVWYERSDLPQAVLDANHAKARTWLVRDDPLPKLLACSWLIGSTSDEEKVIPVLKQLEISTDPRVNGIARVQHWRIKARSAKPDDVTSLKKTLEKIPPGLRAGPKFVLGEAYRQAGQPAQAALEYLWVPFVYGKDNQLLAGQATWQAAQAAEAAQMTADAQKLYRLLIEKYPKTTWAQKSKQRLDQMTSSKGS